MKEAADPDVEFTIRLKPRTIDRLDLLLEAMKDDHVSYITPPDSIEALAELLLEDCAMIVSRPGCWEASNMHTILHSHGLL